MNRTAVVISAVFAAALGAAAVLLVLPDTGPDIDVQHERARPAKKKKKREAKSHPDLQARIEQAHRPRADKEPKRRREALRGRLENNPRAKKRLDQIRDLRSVDGEERAEKREELRSGRFARTEERLRGVGERLAWDDATTDEVVDLMRTSHDEVSAIMESVDRGEQSWEEARPAMRDAREAQADAIRDVLGDEGYDEFTGAMNARSLRAGPSVRARVDGQRPGKLGGRVGPGKRLVPSPL